MLRRNPSATRLRCVQKNHLFWVGELTGEGIIFKTLNPHILFIFLKLLERTDSHASGTDCFFGGNSSRCDRQTSREGLRWIALLPGNGAVPSSRDDKVPSQWMDCWYNLQDSITEDGGLMQNSELFLLYLHHS